MELSLQYQEQDMHSAFNLYSKMISMYLKIRNYKAVMEGFFFIFSYKSA